ncbi:MAG: hypothetical protein FGM39_08540 [Phycisphaerales bacterium]|nr:hypothetical protein [Phycisphaerales bacterium]
MIHRSTSRALLVAIASSLALACVARAQTGAPAYAATSQTLTRYNPGPGTSPPDPAEQRIAYANCYVLAPGATRFRLDSLTVGIRRLGSVTTPAPAVGVEVSVVEMSWTGTTFVLGETVATFSTQLASTTATSTVDVSNSWDSLEPSARPVIDLQTQTNGPNGYGAFWVGVRFSGPDAANNINGWRVVNEPSIGRSLNNFGILRPSTGEWGIFTFGNDATSGLLNPARFMVSASGAALDPVPPPADMLYGRSCENVNWYHPPLDPDGVATRWVYANCFVPAQGSDPFVPTRITAGILRYGTGTGGPAPEVGLELAIVRMGWNGSTYFPREVIASRSFQLDATAEYFTQRVDWDFPSGSAPLVGLETISTPGFGGFWVAARFTGPNAAATQNGWRIAFGPTAGSSYLGFGMNDANGVFVDRYNFGNYSNSTTTTPLPVPARMLVEVRGTVGAPSTCPADLNDDGFVNGDDLGVLLGAWGACTGTCPADLNDDGFVNGDDLGVLLGAWGACPG